MFVQFMLKNVLSFKDETILDMTAINAYKEHESNLINIGIKEKYLRVASIYGANASGKSNLLVGLIYFQRIIAESLNNVDYNGVNAIENYYLPFDFQEEKGNTEFQIVTIINEDEYRYGFEYNNKCIVSEWLYRKNINTNRTSIIFERTVNSVVFGASVRKYCDAYKDQIPTETLVMSFLNKLKLNVDVFRIVYSEIMNTVLIPSDSYSNLGLLKSFLPKILDENKSKLLNFLTAIDTGIKGIGYNYSQNNIEFYTIHLGRDGKEYTLNLFSESEGTLKSIMIFIHAQDAINENRTLFVDEINIKLHPLLLKFIIDLFYNNDSKAQLIYTTHDTTLMNRRFFRRDQIWFVQKDEYGYSELVALSDFKVRPDASFEKDYLSGVYGGIPLIKEFQMKEGE